MRRPPSRPRGRQRPRRLTWRGVLAGYVLLAGGFAGLWVASNPVFGVLAFATVAALVVLGRRAAGLLGCLAGYREITVAPGRRFEVTICRSAAACTTDEPA
jgi:hypothetical protein